MCCPSLINMVYLIGFVLSTDILRIMFCAWFLCVNQPITMQLGILNECHMDMKWNVLMKDDIVLSASLPITLEPSVYSPINDLRVQMLPFHKYSVPTTCHEPCWMCGWETVVLYLSIAHTLMEGLSKQIIQQGLLTSLTEDVAQLPGEDRARTKALRKEMPFSSQETATTQSRQACDWKCVQGIYCCLKMTPNR